MKSLFENFKLQVTSSKSQKILTAKNAKSLRKERKVLNASNIFFATFAKNLCAFAVKRRLRQPFVTFLFFTCLLPCALFAQKQQKIETQNKVYHKHYSINQKDILIVNTNYTKIVFQEWDKNEIDFTTTVTLNNGTEKDMEQLLEGVNISTNQFGKKVSYTLTFCYSNNNKKNKNCNNSFEIILLVKIPKDIFLEIDSRYGNVDIVNVLNDFKADISYGNLNVEELSGNTNKINIKYGKLNIETLFGNNNQINLRYGKFDIRQVNNLCLNIDYSSGKIKEVGTLKLSSRYCTITMDNVKKVDFSSHYDKIFIENNVDKIEGTMRYGTLKINSLKYSCIADMDYSKLYIDEISKSFTEINITSRYTTLMLNLPQEQSFALDYYGRYSKFKDENIRLNEAMFSSKDNTVQMSGIYGKNSDTKKSVKIKANYGTVSLFER
jgi:hypothetical protein